MKAHQALGLLTLACGSSADDPDELPMNMNNPGSIVEMLEEDAERKDYLQVVFDPVRNPDEDPVWVLGVRVDL